MNNQEERIDGTDVEYHQMVVDQNRDAQAAMNSWAAYLSKKYRLTGKDFITADGRIVRQADDQGEAGQNVPPA